MTVKYEEIKRLLKGLSLEDLEQLQEDIARETEKYVGLTDFLNGCAEQIFAKGLVCPHCAKKNIVKFGRAREKQRYRCKDCGKTFNTLTKTVFADSKLPISKRLRYAECMSQQMTLRESGKAVGVCLKTSFYMRQKILSAIKEHIGIDHLSGILEMDESFFAESFKGNHKKGIYHINHINALHSKLKLWMKRKYGVSTKYIGNYMYWFNWSERNRGANLGAQGMSLIYDSISSMIVLTRDNVRETKPF